MQYKAASETGNPCAKHYEVTPGHPPYAPRPRFLGELAGSWYYIGHQIGTKAGDLVRWVSDVWWKEHTEKWGFYDTVEAMACYERQIAALCPALRTVLQANWSNPPTQRPAATTTRS